MTNLTPHASFANKTNIGRWSVDLRYHSFDVPHNVDEAPESYTPERDPVTMACHPAEADFIIRYPQDTSREVTHVGDVSGNSIALRKEPSSVSGAGLDTVA